MKRLYRMLLIFFGFSVYLYLPVLRASASSVLPSDVTVQETSMTKMEDQLFLHLGSLKAYSTKLAEELQILKEQQIVSTEKLTTLQDCLKSTLQQFEQCEASLKLTKDRLTRLQKITLLFLATFVVVRIITIALRFKGVKLPELVNILL